jgi:phage FluMu protein Com
MSFEKPTIWGNGSVVPSAKCPRCKLIMYLGNQCPHCKHWLSEDEKGEQNRFWKHRRNKAIIRGIIFFPILLLLLYWLFV